MGPHREGEKLVSASADGSPVSMFSHVRRKLNATDPPLFRAGSRLNVFEAGLWGCGRHAPQVTQVATVVSNIAGACGSQHGLVAPATMMVMMVMMVTTMSVVIGSVVGLRVMYCGDMYNTWCMFGIPFGSHFGIPYGLHYHQKPLI